MINELLNNLKLDIIKSIKDKYDLDINENDVFFDTPKDKSHGDYSINIAMRLAKPLRKAPIIIANEIIENIDNNKNHLEKVEVLNGFINFFIDKKYLSNVVFKINEEKDNYGNSNYGKGKKVDIEYVSANPTGFLHVGHCRGAAYGDSLARIYKKAGFDVNREYYINDGGNQIENLVKSIYARYNELYGLPFELDDDCYHGKEIIEIAKMIRDEVGDKYIINNDYNYCHDYFRTFGVNYLLNNLKKDLNDFGVNFDTWFSEKSLYDNGDVAKTIEYLKNSGYTYEDEGALWLKTTEYGDEKDRVLIKSDKTLTYLTPDIAYHMNKLSRGYDELIDVLGADHYGYIPRLKAAIKFCGGNPDALNVDILQMVRVMQDGVEVKMSKRSGKAITMRDLIDEVGADALRFLFIQKALSTQMDLDLDLALKQSNENPVYYAQYAYARIRSLFRMYPNFKEVRQFNKIDLNKCEDLITILMQYPSVVVEAASKRIPHRICQYILSLAQALHSYYNDEKIISEDVELTNEKLTLMQAVAYVLKDALSLIGVGTKEKM